jgi:hypothetical protein
MNTTHPAPEKFAFNVSKGVRILRSSTGERFVKLNRGTNDIIPIGIAQLASGKDAWMRNIQCNCRGCKKVFKITDLNEGAWCEECVENSIRSLSF